MYQLLRVSQFCYEFLDGDVDNGACCSSPCTSTCSVTLRMRPLCGANVCFEIRFAQSDTYQIIPSKYSTYCFSKIKFWNVVIDDISERNVNRNCMLFFCVAVQDLGFRLLFSFLCWDPRSSLDMDHLMVQETSCS